MRKKEMQKIIEQTGRERMRLYGRQELIIDQIRAWEEGANPVTTLRRISNLIKYN